MVIPEPEPILLLLKAEELYSKRQLSLARWCMKLRPGRFILCEPPDLA